MKLADSLLLIVALSSAFVLQYVPLAGYFDWFVPQWVFLVFIFWQVGDARDLGAGWIWPLGLLLDCQSSQLLGSHVIALFTVSLLIQWAYQWIKSFNVMQQTALVFCLTLVYLLVTGGSHGLVDDMPYPLSLWLPALVSALVWPWLHLILHSLRYRLR